MTYYLIIDDEHMAHEIIIDYANSIPGLKLVKQCYDALEALEFLRKNQIDLIFLDLNLPRLKGFEFLRSLSIKPRVIVTTAYQEFALEGYELEITDYLLKPFSFERFVRAVNKALEIKKYDSPQISSKATQHTDSIYVYTDKKHIQVTLDEIIYIEAAGNYSKFILEDGQLLVRDKISEVLGRLSQQFIRVHKSYIVSKKHIRIIEGNRIMINGMYIPIGKVFKFEVSKLLKE